MQFVRYNYIYNKTYKCKCNSCGSIIIFDTCDYYFKSICNICKKK